MSYSRDHSRGAAPRVLAMAVLLAVLVLFAACDGDNLFEGGSSVTAGPEIRSLTVPATAERGDTVSIVVDAASDQAIERVGLAVSGAVDLDSIVEIAEPAEEILEEIRLAMPESPTDSLVVVNVVVTDATEATSAVATDTIRVNGGPDIVLEYPEQDDQVQAGLALGIQLSVMDPDGVDRVRIAAAGAFADTIVIEYSPARDSVAIDTLMEIPADANGPFTLRVLARNALGAAAETQAIDLTVVSEQVEDDAAPVVGLSVTGAQRIELTDSLTVSVTARDQGSGIARMGVTAIGVNDGAEMALRPRLQKSFDPVRTGTVPATFRVSPEMFVDSMALPDTVAFRLHAYAVDAAGNCAAAVQEGEQQLACDGATFPGDTVAAGAAGQNAEAVVVTGRTVILPDGGQVADARVDTARNRLYLSNLTYNRVDVLGLAEMGFTHEVLVGSQPWGMFMNASEDTLFVANSGGTNISYVSLDGTPEEDRQRRLFTPNTALFEIHEDVGESGLNYTGLVYDFSDRPMFIAQDSRGRLLYSTKPTTQSEDGSIRLVTEDPVPGATDDLPDVRFLVVGDAINEDSDDIIPIAGIDSVHIVSQSGPDLVILYDHLLGYPESVIQSDPLEVRAAMEDIAAKGSDVRLDLGRGSWIPERVGLSDTTYVAASGNREHIAFGEGGVAPSGRIIVWHSERLGGAGGLSSPTEVVDLVNNASEEVRGVALNQDGSLGVARGKAGSYFYIGADDQVGDLRLQGEFTEGLLESGAGAAFHPLHADARSSDETALAFVGSGRRTIKVINTFHFYEVGEIFVRDNIVGPLRSSLPLPSDNAGLSCPGDENCTVVKLYGITDAGGVVILNVRQKDLQQI